MIWSIENIVLFIEIYFYDIKIISFVDYFWYNIYCPKLGDLYSYSNDIARDTYILNVSMYSYWKMYLPRTFASLICWDSLLVPRNAVNRNVYIRTHLFICNCINNNLYIFRNYGLFSLFFQPQNALTICGKSQYIHKQSVILCKWAS